MKLNLDYYSNLFLVRFKTQKRKNSNSDFPHLVLVFSDTVCWLLFCARYYPTYRTTQSTYDIKSILSPHYMLRRKKARTVRIISTAQRNN